MTVEKNEEFNSSNSCLDEDFESETAPETIYEKLRLIYSRDDVSFLTSRQYRYQLDENLFDLIKNGSGEFQKNGLMKIDVQNNLSAWEIQKQDKWVGVVVENCEETIFEGWFINLLVSTSHVIFPAINNKESQTITDTITEKFVRELKNTTEFDKWEIGESHFKMVVDFFVSRSAPIEAVLPAFPCKSSNLQKVAGPLPDKGEELAIKRLIKFSESVQEVYSPGIKIWIVSDGHVFSDCVAVDDDQVNVYSDALKVLYQGLKPKDKNPIQFCSLVDIFSLKSSNFDNSLVDNIEIGHYLGTKIDEEAEVCRKILVRSCDTDFGDLAKDIKTPDHPRLFLFRGFSRFMTEDLENHPVATNSSRKKFKKIVAKVAFEMIKRNDAYSNLVELIFPFHLRFSIHAHNNAGPKYGVQLLASADCFVIESIEDHETPSYSDLLHIPTPWHNSIVKINDKQVLYVIKSGQIKSGITSGKGSGGWNEESLCFEFNSLKMN